MIDDTIKIKMTKTVYPDFPFAAPGQMLRKGEIYAATSNKHGAICGICANGKALGVRPGEFEFIEATKWLLTVWGAELNEEGNSNA